MPTRMLKLAALASLAAQPIRAEQAPDFAPYPMADVAAEVARARTAAPRHGSDAATVLVLTRNGFVEAARGTNGFTCLVLRSFAGNIGDPDFWNPRVRAPHCFNPPAVRTMLPAALKRAEWVLGGVSLTERSEEHTSELQSQSNLVCRLLLEKKKKKREEQTLINTTITLL